MSLKAYEYRKKSRPSRSRALRFAKMLRPMCEDCSGLGFGWWSECPHDKFHRLKAVVVNTDKRVVDPATGLVTKTESVKKVSHYEHIPNIVQVPLTMRVDSGLSVEMMLAKGFKFPQNVKPTNAEGQEEDYEGYAPMCEYMNCYAPNPKVRARHMALEENRMIPVDRHTGFYCSELHAKLAKQRDQEKTREAAGWNRVKAAEQLDAIPLP